MNVLLRVLKTTAAVIIALVSIPILFLLVRFVVQGVFYSDFGLVSVDPNNIPDLFPVLVMTQEGASWSAETLYYKDLSGYIAEHPTYTFLVPVEDKKRLQKSIKDSGVPGPSAYSVDSDSAWATSFEVLKDSGATQSLKVERISDGDYVNVGWYEATDKEIVPQKYQTNFLGGYMQASFIAVPATVVLWIVSLVTFFVLRRPKKN
jgi:hypothetical protein